MPNPIEEAILTLVCAKPETWLALLQSLALLPLAPHDTIIVEWANPSHTSAGGAPCLLRLERDQQTVMAVNVDVPTGIDVAKKFVWPQAVTGARYRYRCEAALVVVTPYAKVATWARAPILFGPTAGYLQPTVLGPHQAAAVMDRYRQQNTAELAVLAALLWGPDEDVARAVAIASQGIAAARTLSAPHAQLCERAITESLTAVAQAALARQANAPQA